MPVPVPTSSALRTAVDRFVHEAAAVVEPTDPRPGAWVGGPSVVHDGGTWWMAYRVREPLGQGRGIANVLARSAVTEMRTRSAARS